MVNTSSKLKTILVNTEKRKTSHAKVIIKKGIGTIIINDKNISNFENNEYIVKILKILKDIKKIREYDYYFKTKGGGISAQCFAVKLCFAKSIIKLHPTLKGEILKYDKYIISSDSRIKFPKKPGGPGARAKKQKSYR